MESMDDISRSLFENRSDIMGQAALALIERKFGHLLDQQHCQCPHCLRRITAKSEKVKREIQVLVGTVALYRPYFYCNSCQFGFYPLDEALGLSKRKIQPDIQELEAWLAAEMPYETSSETLHRCAGTSLTDQQDTWPAHELLKLYKSQIGIEKNFSFLKDPAIVNSIFLKKAERIEVLGLVLLISLLIWRLMERSMRQYVQKNECTLSGWEKRPTTKPTSFMMTTKFAGILVITIGKHRQLAKPLKPFQRQYLQAMGVADEVFTVP